MSTTSLGEITINHQNTKSFTMFILWRKKIENATMWRLILFSRTSQSGEIHFFTNKGGLILKIPRPENAKFWFWSKKSRNKLKNPKTWHLIVKTWKCRDSKCRKQILLILNWQRGLNEFQSVWNQKVIGNKLNQCNPSVQFKRLFIVDPHMHDCIEIMCCTICR